MSTKFLLNIDELCLILTQRRVVWAKLQNGDIVVWTKGGFLDLDCITIVELFLRHNLYVIEQKYRNNVTTTIYRLE